MKAVFVMIKCQLGHAYKVANSLVERVEQVSEVYSISGQYDLLVKFYLNQDQDTGHFVTETVQTIEGIADTFTIVTFKAFE